jgi:hypothetical protein
MEKILDKIDDLSWSGIVKAVQGDQKIGARIIRACAFERERLEKERIELESKLKKNMARQSELLKGANFVSSHLKKDLPLASPGLGFIVILTEKDLVIERNVI